MHQNTRFRCGAQLDLLRADLLGTLQSGLYFLLYLQNSFKSVHSYNKGFETFKLVFQNCCHN